LQDGLLLYIIQKRALPKFFRPVAGAVEKANGAEKFAGMKVNIRGGYSVIISNMRIFAESSDKKK
jgi:hypothetical protein